MAKYDDASWHYEGDYPKDLPTKNAATHIGMFLAWCINNDLISDFIQEDVKEEINNVKSRKMTGAEYLIEVCDEKFTDEDLSELGQEFATDYYDYDESKFAKKFSNYISDYSDIFFDEDEEKTLYHIEDTWKNYDLLAEILDQRFVQWKKFAKK